MVDSFLKTNDGFIHIADWYATFCNLAGVDSSPVDSLDIWPIITGYSTTSPLHEIVLGYDFDSKGAIISGNYKLISWTSGHVM